MVDHWFSRLIPAAKTIVFNDGKQWTRCKWSNLLSPLNFLYVVVFTYLRYVSFHLLLPISLAISVLVKQSATQPCRDTSTDLGHNSSPPYACYWCTGGGSRGPRRAAHSPVSCACACPVYARLGSLRSWGRGVRCCNGSRSGSRCPRSSDTTGSCRCRTEIVNGKRRSTVEEWLLLVLLY